MRALSVLAAVSAVTFTAAGSVAVVLLRLGVAPGQALALAAGLWAALWLVGLVVLLPDPNVKDF
jgi:hypothetical protein